VEDEFCEQEDVEDMQINCRKEELGMWTPCRSTAGRKCRAIQIEEVLVRWLDVLEAVGLNTPEGKGRMSAQQHFDLLPKPTLRAA
jgi:hypothetical protein